MNKEDIKMQMLELVYKEWRIATNQIRKYDSENKTENSYIVINRLEGYLQSMKDLSLAMSDMKMYDDISFLSSVLIFIH